MINSEPRYLSWPEAIAASREVLERIEEKRAAAVEREAAMWRLIDEDDQLSYPQGVPMITEQRLSEIEDAATAQPGAEHSTLLEYTGGDVHGLVLELVDQIDQLRTEYSQ